MEKELIIKILSTGKALALAVGEIVRQTPRALRQELYTDSAALLSSLEQSTECIVLIDCTGDPVAGKETLKSLLRLNSRVYTIMIISEKDSLYTDDMLNAGAYDVITDGSLGILGHSLSHLLPFLDDRLKLRQLSREKQFADNIVNNSRSMISIINRDYVYEKVNRTFSMNHNSEIENIVGCSLEEIWGRDNFENNIRKRIDTCLAGKVVYYQAFFTTPAWGKRYYEVIMRPVTDETDNITHVMAETYDVTDLKIKEQAASAIEWEFRNLESNLPIGFFRSDRKGRLLHVNKAFLRIMQMASESEASGKPLSAFYSEKELSKHHMKTILADGSASFSGVVLISATGKEINCRISAFAVRDGSGNQIYIDGAIEDYTREVDLEKRLMQAQKLDTIGLFAGGIAHDFNTILTTIYGYSELSLEELDSSSEASANIKKIIQAVGRARQLTGQILTFSRQVGQERIRVRVADIILETADFLRPTLPSSIVVDCDMRQPEACVSADPTQLFRVLLNLMKNSVQAMEGQSGTITVTLDICSGGRVDEVNPGTTHAGDYVMISVGDTGPGMDASMTERIFEPFFTARRGGRGTGLGLSVVYGIISEIEGEISVQSKKGEGTTVSIFVPLHAGGGTKEPEHHAAKLLVIPASDNETKVISIALASSGYDVTMADPSGDFVKKASQADLIVIVDNIPDVTAAEVVGAIERNGIKKPMLLISEIESWLADEKSLPSDIMKNNLFKPVSLKEILTALDTLLNKRD